MKKLKTSWGIFVLVLVLITSILACTTHGGGRGVTETADVIVIGAGGAGFAAAMAAHQGGSSVILLESMNRPGGNTMIAGGAFQSVNPTLQSQLAMTDAHRAAIMALVNKPPHDNFERDLQQTVRKQLEEFTAANRPGLFDSVEWHALQSYNAGDYIGTPELVMTLTSNLPPTREWMTTNGMQWSTNPNINVRIFTVLGGLWQRSNRPEMPLGTGFIDMGVRYVEANSDRITLHLETRATEFIVENGRVTGVRATGPGGDRNFMATRGVVLATGGFGANVEMRQRYNDMGNPPLWGPGLRNALSTNHPGTTGDGIMMAESIGANLVGMEWIQMLPMGDPRTGSLSGNIEMGVEDRFFVNKNGDRFMDEGGRRDYMTNALLAQPDSWMWVICDAQSYPDPVNNRNNFGETIVQLVEAGRAFQADTIEELARLIDVPPANLRRAVDEFNAGVAAGTDRFGRSLWRIRIDQPPFYAGARIPTVHHTMGGVEINNNAQVINTAGRVIPGLFAAGEVTGGIHGTNRVGGNALADIFVFGRIAGTNAAAVR